MSNQFFKKLTNVCHSLLLENESLMYYLKVIRGISIETINMYNIGAFPEDLRDLYHKHDMDPIQLREENIIWNADQSQFQLYPIVIPIRDIRGDPIAIGCRTLLDDVKRKRLGIPKYRNSSYKKTYHLFGLDKAIESIRINDEVFVVEGYFDQITPWQKGIGNVVATCGTIFSERQLAILSRYTKNISLLFDNDDAGRTSAKKVIHKMNIGEITQGVNLTCKFTPNGYKDLDEYLRNNGSINLFENEKIEINDTNVLGTLW